MKICSMICDNLEWVNYRVEYISNRLILFDLVIWFGGDHEQCKLLEIKREQCLHPNVKIVNLNHKIKNGSDFAIMQDLSFAHIKENYKYSICAFQSADELLTEFGIQAVKLWIEHSDDQFAVFTAMSNKFFCETFIAPLVFQIFRGGVEYRSNNGLSDNTRFCNKVEITKNMYHTNLGYSDTEHLNYVIDTGYINAEAAYQKAVNWSRLCYGDSNTPGTIALYATDKAAFIKRYIHFCRGEFHGATDHKIILVQYQGEYKRLIDDLNLKADYDFTCKVIEQINTNKS